MFAFFVFTFISFFDNVIFVDRETDKSINEHVYISNSNGFVKNNIKQEVDYGFELKEGLIGFSLENKDSAQSYIVWIQQSRVDFVQLYVERNSGVVDTLPLLNKSVGIFDRPVKSVNFCYEVKLEKREKVNCFIRSGRQYGNHACVVSVNSENHFYRYNTFLNIYVSFISGICLVISLSGFFLFLFFRNVIYLIYSLYCLSSFFVTCSDAGYMHSFFPSENILYINNNITTIAFYNIVGCHILLTMALLKLNKTELRFFYYLGLTSSIIFILTGISLLFPQISGFLRANIIKASYYIVFFMDVYILTALILNIRKKQIFVYFYLFGFLFTLVASTILLLANLGVIDGINQNYDLAYSIPLVEVFCMLVGVSFQFSDQNRKLIESQYELSQSQKKVIHIQDEEQRRIAQDLHDGIGQDLLILKKRIATNDNSVDLVENIIDDLRKVSRELYPVTLSKTGLKIALENLCNQLNDVQSIFVSCDIDYHNNIETAKKLQVYRIVQECMNNALKHSYAKALRVEIKQKGEFLNITILDNGVGFDVAMLMKSEKSFGLHTINNRVKSLNGVLEMASKAGETKISIQIPLV